MRSLKIFFLVIFILTIQTANANLHIPVLVLSGSYPEMGFTYGKKLEPQLKKSLSVLKQFYIVQHHISYARLKKQAELFYARFTHNYQLFIQGVAAGAHLSLNDAKILNAMETLGRLISENTRCAFLALPPRQSQQHTMLIGRNYDFSPPLNKLAKFLTITVLHEKNKIPTAFISVAGEIYCPTCINAKGLFMELNNGMPSGGYFVNQKRASLLIEMLQIMQNSTTLMQMEKQLNAIQSDYSLIINIANQSKIESYEYSSLHGMKVVSPNTNQPFASTNYFLNPHWNVASPTDATTWKGVTRRNNLLNLMHQKNNFNIKNFESLMNKNIKSGGAANPLTIYQLIFDPSQLTLYVKINSQGNHWEKIRLSSVLH